MTTARYRFIPTDQVSEMNDAEKDLATIHREDDHNPEDHLCTGCLHIEKEYCWAIRNNKEPEKFDQPRKMDEYGDKDCHCGCHYLIDQCRFTQNAVKNDGRPMYRLETEQDGWSMILPAAIYDSFMMLSEEQRDSVVTLLISQAKHIKESE